MEKAVLATTWPQHGYNMASSIIIIIDDGEANRADESHPGILNAVAVGIAGPFMFKSSETHSILLTTCYPRPHSQSVTSI